MNIGVYFNSFEHLTGLQSEIVNSISEVQKIDKKNDYYTVGGVSSYIKLPAACPEKVLINNNLILNKDLYNKKIHIIHSYYPAFEDYLNGVQYLITINDMIPCIHPEWFPVGRKAYFEGPIRRSVKMSKKVFAISESTKNDIVNIFDVEPEKIEVIYIGLSKNIFNETKDTGIIEKLFLYDEFILSVCTLEPRKNLRGLIKAFIDYKESTPDSLLKLVIAGGRGWDNGFFEWIETLGNKRKDIIIAGYVSDSELSELYRKSMAVAYVSFYEGFGLPILEGMAAGKAVICSNTSSMTEVGGDAVCYCNPYNTESIAEAIKRVVENEKFRNELGCRAYTRANLFSYKKTAEQIVNVYNSLE